MAGQVPQTDAGPAPAQLIKIRIAIGVITLDYEGPASFLDQLPAILVELQKFEDMLKPTRSPQ
jgi:hypothetical protein